MLSRIRTSMTRWDEGFILIEHRLPLRPEPGAKIIISIFDRPRLPLLPEPGGKIIISILTAIAFRSFLNQGKGVDASMKSDLTTGASGGHFANNGQAIKVTAGNTILSYSDGWGTWPWACTACV